MSAILSFLVGGNKPSGVELPSVKIHNVENDPDRRARCLKHLLKANHVNYSILYNHLRFDNHNVHILGSAYLLGATEDQLNAIYNSEILVLEPWVASPAEVIEEDWRDFWGDRRYQRAFVDFFEDQLALNYGYDWQKELRHYLFSGQNPLFHGLIGGLGHPLIHLAYAYETNSKEVATEALGLASCSYNFFHKYLDDASYTKPSPIPSDSPLQLLTKMSKDERFNALNIDTKAHDHELGIESSDLEKLFHEHESLILEYWNAWVIENPTKDFQLSQQAAVALLVATVRPSTELYNFYVVHLLTTSHAVRVLLPFFPREHHVALVREWWLLTLAIFVMRGRPLPDMDNLDKDLKGKTWKHVEYEALNSQWAKDAHFVKASRAMKEASNTWGDEDRQYLRAALTFVDNFRGWSF